ncbi:hypothetical protein SEUCBS140593_008469, partial [Sporothrix eucalyptigena]
MPSSSPDDPAVAGERPRLGNEIRFECDGDSTSPCLECQRQNVSCYRPSRRASRRRPRKSATAQIAADKMLDPSFVVSGGDDVGNSVCALTVMKDNSSCPSAPSAHSLTSIDSMGLIDMDGMLMTSALEDHDYASGVAPNHWPVALGHESDILVRDSQQQQQQNNHHNHPGHQQQKHQVKPQPMFSDLWLSTLDADLDIVGGSSGDAEVDFDMNPLSSRFSTHSPNLLSPGHSEASSDGLQSVSDTSSGWEASSFAETIPHIKNNYPSGRDSYLGPSIIFMSGAQVGQAWRRLSTGTAHPGTQKLLDFLETADMQSKAIKKLTESKYDPDVLPTMEVALTYVDAYFRHIQCLLPIIDYPVFMDRFKRSYPLKNGADNPTWTALVNAVLAVGSRTVSQEKESSFNESQSCALLANAMAYMPSIIIGSLDIIGVQALVVMFVFLNCSRAPHSAYMVLSSAIRMSQALGLHVRPYTSWGLNPDQIRERNLLFWCMFCLDLGMCYYSGRPPQMCLAEITVPLPHTLKGSLPTLGPYAGRSKIGCNVEYEDELHGLFLTMIKTCKILVKIQAWTRKDTYDEGMSRTALALDAEQSLPPNWRFSDGLMPTKLDQVAIPLLPSLVQISCYILNARWVLYTRLDMFMMGRTNELLPLDAIFNHGYGAASVTILLIQALPIELMPSFWLFEHQTVHAFWVLFVAVMIHPTIPAAEEYLNLMASVAENIAVDDTVSTVLSNKPLS